MTSNSDQLSASRTDTQTRVGFATDPCLCTSYIQPPLGRLLMTAYSLHPAHPPRIRRHGRHGRHLATS